MLVEILSDDEQVIFLVTRYFTYRRTFFDRQAFCFLVACLWRRRYPLLCLSTRALSL